MQTIPIFLPGEFHGQRSLTGYSPWVCKESDTAEQIPPHFNHVSVRTEASKSVKPYHSFDKRTSLLVSNSLSWLKKNTHTYTHTQNFKSVSNFFFLSILFKASIQNRTAKARLQ